MKPQVREIKKVHSIILSTITPDELPDETLSRESVLEEQIYPFACTKMFQSMPVFKRLYEQAARTDAPNMLSTGMTGAREEFDKTLELMLKSKGITLAAVIKSEDEQVFSFSGRAQNPVSKTSFDWTVYILFQFSSDTRYEEAALKSHFSMICPNCKNSIFDRLEDGLRQVILTIANTHRLDKGSDSIEFPCPYCGVQLYAEPSTQKVYRA